MHKPPLYGLPSGRRKLRFNHRLAFRRAIMAKAEIGHAPSMYANPQRHHVSYALATMSNESFISSLSFIVPPDMEKIAAALTGLIP